MPPGNRSSSSHSSSSRSSSSRGSSSSRSSSSRSSSIFGRSGSSSHSSSSHSSRSIFGNSGSRSSSFGRDQTGSPFSGLFSSGRSGPSAHSSSSHSSRPVYDQPQRRNVPQRTASVYPEPSYRRNSGSAGLASLIYYGLLHNYSYYDKPREINGKTYEPGYYDENGTRYDNLKMQNADGTNTLILKCDYCGTTTKLDWKEGDIPCCSNCGAPLSLDNVQEDTIRSSETPEEYSSPAAAEEKNTASGKTTIGKKLLVWIAVILGGIFILTGLNSCGKSDRPEPIREATAVQVFTPTQQKKPTAAVRSLGLARNPDGSYMILSGTGSKADKTLQYDENTGNFYDAETDTYLYYNTNVTPAVWQYWIEGVSSEYGDFGWMEYDSGKWYIEVSSGSWQQYTGRTSGFLRISDPAAEDPSGSAAAPVSGSTIRLRRNSGGSYTILDDPAADADKELTYDEATGTYYDRRTDTYLLYNTDVTPAVWQYWIEGVSSEYGDFGWMEYDSGKWYIEVSSGSWQQYTGRTVGFWHISD